MCGLHPTSCSILIRTWNRGRLRRPTVWVLSKRGWGWINNPTNCSILIRTWDKDRLRRSTVWVLSTRGWGRINNQPFCLKRDAEQGWYFIHQLFGPSRKAGRGLQHRTDCLQGSHHQTDCSVPIRAWNSGRHRTYRLFWVKS